MYIIKNALKCISRSKGRNILIGVIVFVIALSACIGLSIRQAAESAREETLKNLKITASISFDRSSMMKEFGGNGSSGGFDREEFSEKMENMSSLTLEDYQKYAKADSVEDFYYTLTTSVNGTDDFSSVTTETENESFSPLDSLMGKNNANAYVTEISSAMNFTVVLQMLGIGVLLTLISGAVSMLFIMRYEPLKILANRD